jgi:hypothetical protein
MKCSGLNVPQIFCIAVKGLNWKYWLTAGMRCIMLATLLLVSKCVWLMFFNFIFKSLSFVYVDVY